MGRREIRVGEVKWVIECYYQETVRIKMQVDMPFQIGDGHGQGWQPGVCE